MAAVTVNPTGGSEQQLSNRIWRGFRAKVDAFVSDRIQHAVSEAARVKGFKRREPEGFVAKAFNPTEVSGVELKPLGEDILSAAIPAFFIGRNRSGLWIAREATGRTGGIFLLKSSAVAFARAQSDSGRCAMISPSERFELDLENEGNRFARHFESLLRIGREIGRCVLTSVLALLVLAAIVALQAAIHVYVYLWRLVG